MTFISRYFLLSFFLFFSTFSLAQKTIIIEGLVTEAGTGQALPFAILRITDKSGQFLTGATSDDLGRFSIETPALSHFQLKASYVGYQMKDTLITWQESFRKIELILSLVPESNELQEVVVEGEEMLAKMKMDRQSYTASQLGNTTSGTGLDLLGRLPAVTINGEGNILFRGNAEILVTVNGVLTNQTASDILSQIPANQIEKVELLTTPSARMDADGRAGIINIVTKKEYQRGWGVTLNGNFSHFDPPRYGSDLSFHHNAGKFTSYLSANLRRYDIGGSRIGEIRTLVGDTLTYSPSSGPRPTSEKILGFRAGTTFSDKKGLTASLGGFVGQRQNNRIANLTYREFSILGESLDYAFNQAPDRTFLNENLFVRKGNFLTVNTELSKTFPSKHRLNLAAVYEESTLGGPLRNQDTDVASGQITLKERSEEDSPLQGWRLQGDYLFPISENLSLESGMLWKGVRQQGDFIFERLNLESEEWEKDPDFNDYLDLQQRVTGGYLQLSGSKNLVSFSAGLRGEHTFRELNHSLGTRPYIMDRFDFFPSFQALWKHSSMQDWRLSYSKRIDRPTTRDLAPFKNHRHSEAIWQGDPDLQPEISHTLELGMTRNQTFGSLSINAYHSRVSDLIFRVNQPYNRIILLTLATNAGDSRSTGMEVIYDREIGEKINLYLSGNTYFFQLKNVEIANQNSTSSLNYNLNGNIAYKPGVKWRIQWDATYLSQTVTAQGTNTDLLLSNIGAKYQISPRLSGDLIFQNIFNTNFQTINTRGPEFISSTEYGKYDRIIQLSLSYSFNGKSKTTKQVKTEYGERDF